MKPGAAPRKAMAEELAKLNENMQTLAELSELSIRKAIEGLQDMNPEGAKEVFALDQEIYALMETIEKDCVDIIALHAPVALDLRTITTSLKITTDLDRIGRYSWDIAEIAISLGTGATSQPKKIRKMARMADLTIHMVDTAIRAFTSRDAASVRNIGDFDNAVDDLHDEIFKEIITQISEGTLPADIGVKYILVNRYLERIADHAVNVGHGVVYMVTGERQFPKFGQSKEQQVSETGEPPQRLDRKEAAWKPSSSEEGISSNDPRS